MDDSLHRFVHDAIAKGIPRQQIEDTLLAARWPRDEVRGVFDLFADVDFPLPVPRPRPYLSAREAFIYLVLFTLLYLCAWSLGALLFQFVDRAFPDPAQASVTRDFVLDTVRWSVAALLIAFPGYLVLSRRTYSAARRDPEKRKSKVRKWLTYLTLFLAAGVLLGDVITLVYHLLEGELTARFLLKVAAVAGVAGAIFGYYLWDLKQDDLEPEEIPARRPALRLFAGGVTAVVLVSLVGGLYLAGSPGRARKRALDGQRETHLMVIANMIDLFWRQEGRLPRDLEELRRTRDVRLPSIHDPASGEPYGYSITSETGYEVCAVFEAESEPEGIVPVYRDRYDATSGFWEHGAGRECFAVEVRREDD
jgi:hypothetical protein